ncbi:MAG: hypothetical protein ACP5FK_04010 [bacterium]
MMKQKQKGIALILALSILVAGALLVAAAYVLAITDVRISDIIRHKTKAFRATEAGAEQVTATLGTIYQPDHGIQFNVGNVQVTVDTMTKTTKIVPGYTATWTANERALVALNYSYKITGEEQISSYRQGRAQILVGTTVAPVPGGTTGYP